MTRRFGLVLAGLLVSGCSAGVPGTATPAGTASVGALPGDVEALGELVLTDVPSGLPLVPDDELEPPAGPKTLDDVAGYSDDVEREEQVLTDYGYRWGWERFWRDDGGLTSVFVDQFESADGAESYAADLARNDTDLYGGNPDRSPDGLPDGCSTLAVDDPAEESGLTAPTVFAWCAHGPFAVAVAVVGDSSDTALAEVDQLVDEQLDRLPRG
ncbi:hypothetical protein SAMN05660199_01626 [Klenkia soli]|uniref:DUF7373 domain-containing protein n=1 Tax=Klenkia soli TaxID=1052260 RepID=A0A1H0HZG6_9ACTN|nr:hypothetical protein [Klenkia soli]SDO24544.1 hypothetical protein SAMN05660199_01626 [Klenkia soli]